MQHERAFEKTPAADLQQFQAIANPAPSCGRGGSGNSHSPGFKTKVALAAIEGEKTPARPFDLHPHQIPAWKARLKLAPSIGVAPRRQRPPIVAATRPAFDPRRRRTAIDAALEALNMKFT